MGEFAANYVYHRVLCAEADFEAYFLDPEPFGSAASPDAPYITFRKLFGREAFSDFDAAYSARVYYGYGACWKKLPEGRVELKFYTRWQYPIKVILQALKVCGPELVWYACEENHIYVSKFQWQAGRIEEQVMPLAEEYWDWLETNEARLEHPIEECDDAVWYFPPLDRALWLIWPSGDGRWTRYDGIAAVHVACPEWSALEQAKNKDVSVSRGTAATVLC